MARGLAALLALSLCASEASAQAPQTVTDFLDEELALFNGVVFGDDGAPIADARVEIGGVTLTTNRDGGFRAKLRPGTYTVDVEAPGGARQIVTNIELRPGRSAELVITVFRDGRPPLADLEGGQASASGAGDKDAGPRPEDLGPPGEVSGRVTVLDEDAPIEGARVFVRGAPVEATTDAEGRFVLALPPGTYELSLIHPEFNTQSVPNVEVRSEEQTAVAVEMSPAAVALADFTVYIPRIEGSTASLLEERREAATMNEVIGAEQFSKSGDSSAAGALKRVTGLTVVGGKYVYVRGLGDRYSSTLLNGSTLPSPEPDKRVVPLDLFPTALLESVTIQKTYSPNMPGEFGGGVVSLKTRGVPDSFQASLSTGVGVIGGATFSEVTFFEGGKLDWLGVDDGTRALPEEVREAGATGKIRKGNVLTGEGYTSEELEELGEAMPATWGEETRRAMPNLGLSGTIGDRFSLFGRDAGVRAAFTFSNSWDVDNEYRAFVRSDSATGELGVRDEFDFVEANNNIVFGAILTGVMELDEDNEIKLTSMVNRVTDNTSRIYEGFNRDAGTQIRVARGRWLERMLLFEQLVGTHRFGEGFGVQWRYVYSRAGMKEPDRRETRYDKEGEEFLMSTLPENNSRLYSELRDNNHDVAFDLERAFTLGSEREGKWATGAQFVYKDREVDTRRYKYKDVRLDGDLRVLTPEELFAPEYIGEQLQFDEITRPTDNYVARQVLAAAYAMVALPLGERLTMSGGARLERSDQNVQTFELFAADQDAIEASLVKTDLLPALNATWELTEKMQVRAAASRTVTRPDFRELSPAGFNDVIGGNQVRGNPELERGTITHADARWEFYPDVGESISASLFYKFFDSPIEEIIIPGAVDTLTYENAESAHDLGLEVEARKNLDFVSEALRDFYVSGNVALIYSRVTLPDIDLELTSTQRPLQGQSPYVVNAQFGYDDLERGLSATLLYNVFGPRIASIGTQGIPDTYERPFHQLDLTMSYKLGAGFRLGAKAKNLLNLPASYRIGDVETFREVRGRSFSVSVGKKF